MRVVLTSLLVGVLYAGATMNLSGWPFACYPTFHQEISHKMPLMSVVVRDQKGQARRIHHQRYLRPDNRAWGENWRLAGFYSPVDEKVLRAFTRSRIKQFVKSSDYSVTLYRSSINLLSHEVEDHKLLSSFTIEALK